MPSEHVILKPITGTFSQINDGYRDFKEHKLPINTDMWCFIRVQCAKKHFWEFLGRYAMMRAGFKELER